MNVRFINEHNEIVNEPNEIMVVHDISSQKTLQNSVIKQRGKILTHSYILPSRMLWPKQSGTSIIQQQLQKVRSISSRRNQRGLRESLKLSLNITTVLLKSTAPLQCSLFGSGQVMQSVQQQNALQKIVSCPKNVFHISFLMHCLIRTGYHSSQQQCQSPYMLYSWSPRIRGMSNLF